VGLSPWAVRSDSVRTRRPQDAKDQPKKMAAPKSGQVQEETPRKGSSIAEQCRTQQYDSFRRRRKAQSITILDKTPQKAWENYHICHVFDPTAASFGMCASQQKRTNSLTWRFHHTDVNTQQKIRVKRIPS